MTKKMILSMFVLLLFIGSVYAQSNINSVNYDNKRDLVVNNGTKYQRIFYDWGTPIPGDNARIFGKSYGNTKNFAYIKFADYGSTNFEKRTATTSNNTEAYVNYTSKHDYLQPGSFAHTTGFKLFELHVIK